MSPIRRFLDTVIGIPGSRCEIVMLRSPDGGTQVELSSFVRPDARPGQPAAMAESRVCATWPSRSDDLQTNVDRLHTQGYGLVGRIGQYEQIWKMATCEDRRGSPVSLAERIG